MAAQRHLKHQASKL